MHSNSYIKTLLSYVITCRYTKGDTGVVLPPGMTSEDLASESDNSLSNTLESPKSTSGDEMSSPPLVSSHH